jgi:hypothetical protein
MRARQYRARRARHRDAVQYPGHRPDRRLEKLKGRFYEAPFAWGGIADLTGEIDEIRRTPPPFFVYADVLAPYPPIRFRADCSIRATDRICFAGTICATSFHRTAAMHEHSGTGAAAEDREADADALIILQSDHGTAFGGQFEKPSTDWSEADLHERFGALDALRLPEPCRTLVAPDSRWSTRSRWFLPA